MSANISAMLLKALERIANAGDVYHTNQVPDPLVVTVQGLKNIASEALAKHYAIAGPYKIVTDVNMKGGEWRLESK